jgi:hypothetical protein
VNTDVTVHRSADGFPVEVGKRFWSNDLRVVEITQVAAYSNRYQELGMQTWHKTTDGSFDTLDGSLQRIGRLVRYYDGRDAEKYAPGTNFSEIK